MKKTYISVPKDWLVTLLELSEESGKAVDKWYKGTKPLMPTVISKLIGFSSSANTILKFNEATEENI